MSSLPQPTATMAHYSPAIKQGSLRLYLYQGIAGKAGNYFFRRFAREARVLARLDHPNILPVYDYGEQYELTYLVMPYMAKGSLKDLLQVRHVFATTDALLLTAQILHALQYAHGRGLIHRDIKPENILFKGDGTAVLSDFGLVKVLAPLGDNRSPLDSATQTGEMIAATLPIYTVSLVKCLA